ncbi:hypothetical protein AAMO2058_001221100 [Amorphochlora amoebiformis]
MIITLPETHPKLEWGPVPPDHLPTKTAHTPMSKYISRNKKIKNHGFDSEFFKDFYPKSASGLVGLANQGGTCYLNSFVQTLRMLSEFRESLVTEIKKPDSHKQGKRDILLQLCRLICRLEESEMGAVTTLPLCRAFGWDKASMFRQHDVQEFYHALKGALRKQRATLAPQLDEIFFGEQRILSRCAACGKSSERAEKFSDISLVVEGFNHLEASLEQFTGEEILTGSNKVRCSKCASKQEATRQICLSTLPKALIFHLKRFRWDFSTGRGRRVKNEDFFGIPATLSLPEPRPRLGAEKLGKIENDFKKSAEGKTKPTTSSLVTYHAVSILMHTGLAATGHYYAFIRVKGKWYQFDDQRVTEISRKDASSMFCTLQDIKKAIPTSQSTAFPSPPPGGVPLPLGGVPLPPGGVPPPPGGVPPPPGGVPPPPGGVPPPPGGVPPPPGGVPPPPGGVPPALGGVPPAPGGVPPALGGVPPAPGGVTGVPFPPALGGGGKRMGRCFVDPAKGGYMVVYERESSEKVPGMFPEKLRKEVEEENKRYLSALAIHKSAPKEKKKKLKIKKISQTPTQRTPPSVSIPSEPKLAKVYDMAKSTELTLRIFDCKDGRKCHYLKSMKISKEIKLDTLSLKGIPRHLKKGKYFGEVWCKTETVGEFATRCGNTFSGEVAMCFGEYIPKSAENMTPSDALVTVYLWDIKGKALLDSGVVLVQSRFQDAKADKIKRVEGVKEKLIAGAGLPEGKYKFCRIPAWLTSELDGVASVPRSEWDNVSYLPLVSGNCIVLAAEGELNQLFDAEDHLKAEKGIHIQA